MGTFMEHEVKAKYPDLAYLLGNPEVGPILIKATQEEWSLNKFQAEIAETGWWKNTSSAVRAYDDLLANDPATAARKVDVVFERADDWLNQMGMHGSISEAKIREISTEAVRNGWSDEELTNVLADQLVYKRGAAGQEAIAGEIRALAADYFIGGIDDATMGRAVQTVLRGDATMEGVEATFRAWARQLYPHLGEILDTGITLRQYAQPLRQQIASVLEMNPNEIDPVKDPRWASMLAFSDGTSGQPRAMTLTEAANFARQQTEWQFTANANNRAAELGQTVNQVFFGG